MEQNSIAAGSAGQLTDGHPAYGARQAYVGTWAAAAPVHVGNGQAEKCSEARVLGNYRQSDEDGMRMQAADLSSVGQGSPSLAHLPYHLKQ